MKAVNSSFDGEKASRVIVITFNIWRALVENDPEKRIAADVRIFPAGIAPI